MELTTIKGGINRLRTKGAAPNDSLYDLLNGFVTAARTIESRPGTFRHAVLPSDESGSLTKGLVSFAGLMHVFAAEAVDGIPAGFELHVISHPERRNESDNSVIQISKIHFAKPFMNFLYVVAEFEPNDYSDTLGNVFHFWLQLGEEWEADKVYKLGDLVIPSTPNGFTYRATRRNPANASWAPNVQRTLGDVIEPTVYNDFYYTVVDTLGDNPRSGTVEPEWPTSAGERIFEDAGGTDTSTGGSGATSTPDSSSMPSPATQDRYDPDLLPGQS